MNRRNYEASDTCTFNRNNSALKEQLRTQKFSEDRSLKLLSVGTPKLILSTWLLAIWELVDFIQLNHREERNFFLASQSTRSNRLNIMPNQWNLLKELLELKEGVVCSPRIGL